MGLEAQVRAVQKMVLQVQVQVIILATQDPLMEKRQQWWLWPVVAGADGSSSGSSGSSGAAETRTTTMTTTRHHLQSLATAFTRDYDGEPAPYRYRRREKMEGCSFSIAAALGNDHPGIKRAEQAIKDKATLQKDGEGLKKDGNDNGNDDNNNPDNNNDRDQPDHM